MEFPMLKKILWLVAGIMVGAGLSSTIANTRQPASYQFTVVAVSVEDATERASEMMKEGELRSDLSSVGLISATFPKCSEKGNAYSCETHLQYSL
jgi:hypothetical protein